MPSDKIITCWASLGRENYNAAQLRLIRSCIDSGWDGEYMMRTLDGYVDEYLGVKIYQGHNPQCKKWPLANNHSEIPYGFKPAAIQECRERGFRFVIWMDSSMRLLNNPQQYIDYAATHGICAFENSGHSFAKYTTDIALERLGITFDDLHEVKNIMACALIFDFNHPSANIVFDAWIAASHDGVSFQNGYGSIRTEFVATRHDQSCLAGLLWLNNVPILPYGGLAYGDHWKTKEYGEVTFLNQGIV